MTPAAEALVKPLNFDTPAAVERMSLSDSDKAMLHKVDEVALRTLKNCMLTVYEDGPRRDMRLWWVANGRVFCRKWLTEQDWRSAFASPDQLLDFPRHRPRSAVPVSLCRDAVSLRRPPLGVVLRKAPHLLWRPVDR